MPDCKECGEECPSDEFLRRHIRRHKMTAQEYALKWVYDGKVPLCKCGCGQETSWNVALKAYAEFVLGHHAWGRKKSEEEKKAIGKANSINMTRYMSEHPEVAKLRNKQMLAAHTPEMTIRRLESTRRAYTNLSVEQRQKFRDHALRLLEAGLIGPQAPFKTQWMHNPFTDQDEYMHSSWESAFLQRCIEQDFPVTKKHDIRISYTDPNGVERTYVPDFVGLESPVIFEVKGRRDETVDLKETACREWCEQHGYELVMIESI